MEPTIDMTRYYSSQLKKKTFEQRPELIKKLTDIIDAAVLAGKFSCETDIIEQSDTEFVIKFLRYLDIEGQITSRDSDGNWNRIEIDWS